MNPKRMNLPALKGGVSLSKSRRVKRHLLGEIPAVMAVINVRLDDISSYITNTAKNFPGLQKWPLRKCRRSQGCWRKSL